MKNKKLFQAFSLIEMMVVIVILGILASIAVPSYQGYKNASQIRSATELMITDINGLFSYTRSHSGAVQVISFKKGDKEYKTKTCEEECYDISSGNLDTGATWTEYETEYEYTNVEIIKIEGGPNETSLSEIMTEIELVFAAPFGNVDINNSKTNSSEVLKVTLGNGSKTASFFVFLKSGFVYRVNKIEDQ